MRATLKRLGIQTIYSGPYSYCAAPIELLFGGLKDRNLNPNFQPLGKK